MSLQLASLFQDHAVLQRDQPLPVWGWGPPLARIRVTLGPHTACVISNEHGDFLVRLPPLPAGGPHSLSVAAVETGERVEAHDLLVGEVWLASGQSNMEWPLEKSRPLTDADIASADFPHIRFFNVAPRAHLGEQRTVGGRWQVASPATAGAFSAVAFACARRLHRDLGVPVGVISSSWGGSIIQSWMSRSALARNPDIREWLGRFESEAWTEKRWALMKAPGPDGRVINFPADPGNMGAARGWAQAAFDDSGWEQICLPASWQSAGHRHSGVFWFRRQIEIPGDWVGRELCLGLGGADKQDVAYVNGVEVGRTGENFDEHHWNKNRAYVIPAALVTGTFLTVAVRVYSFVYEGGLIGPESAMAVRPAGAPEEDGAVSLAGPWRLACEHDLGVVTERHVMGHGERNTPHMLFDNMIRPLAPYALRGALWYQGETNANEGAAPLYAGLLRDLVLDWRDAWGRPELAFHLVQLPGHKPAQAHQPESEWARLREAQLAALALPDTGIAIVIDLGEAGDIHPKNKIPVGERLARSVLAITYARAGAPCGPLFERLTNEGGALRCHFRHAEGGLKTSDGQAPRLFFIAGESRVFLPADARIESASVVVSHPDVSRPVAVRYAWADNPEGCNLAGEGGLPASPFRSDRW